MLEKEVRSEAEQGYTMLYGKFYLILALTLLVIFAGCSTRRVTDPPKTATEQFLLSQAAVKAVKRLSFEALYGRKVFVDTSYYAAAEKEFVFGELRAKLLNSGVQIIPTQEKAEIVLELRGAGIGIDRYDSLVGIPSLLPPPATATGTAGWPTASLVVPELAITKNIEQYGFASIGYVAYWRQTGEVVAASLPAVGRTYREDWWFFGFGPRTIGDIAPVERKVK